MITELFRLTAIKAQSKFKYGSLTVERYAKSLLSRIDARDATVHAWAYVNPGLVLERARARELDQVALEKRDSLHGMAIGVKDVILSKDMPTQYSSPIYVSDHPETNAGSVMVSRERGALIFGISSSQVTRQPGEQ
jgi:Asp-tRNA(Asn)/Glu-tRNA(Gln) amidotransferase A subunit family amidase